MKVQATNTQPKFNPVQVIITLETPEEFKALYQVSNYIRQQHKKFQKIVT